MNIPHRRTLCSRVCRICRIYAAKTAANAAKERLAAKAAAKLRQQRRWRPARLDSLRRPPNWLAMSRSLSARNPLARKGIGRITFASLSEKSLYRHRSSISDGPQRSTNSESCFCDCRAPFGDPQASNRPPSVKFERISVECAVRPAPASKSHDRIAARQAIPPAVINGRRGFAAG